VAFGPDGVREERHLRQPGRIRSFPQQPRVRWLAVRAGWLLLAASVLAGAVSAVVTWWSGPDNALNADAFQVNRFDITGIVPAGYAVFAMALGICSGAPACALLSRRQVTIPAKIVINGAALDVNTIRHVHRYR
jgi:hypothetical protein